MSKKKGYWKDGLSVDETRFSVLVLMVLAGFGYALFSHYLTGDISDNLLSLVQTLIAGIVGVNVANLVTETLRGGRENKEQPPYNEDATEKDGDKKEGNKNDV